MSRFPSFSQWKQLLRILNKREKAIFGFLAITAAVSLAFLASDIYFSNTKIVPAFGGTYTEGIIGQPRFINPLYGETNDTDRTLLGLVFSGLMSYDPQGRIVQDLAKNYTVSEDGKTYDVTLKDNLTWHDGRPLNADDVVFSIQTIQNSDYKSPLRANWINVTAQKTGENSVRFLLQASYNSFLENLTVKILPKHIWQAIAPANAPLSSYNLQPVGSGPFEFADITQDANGSIASVTLVSNRHYWQASHLSAIIFKFYQRPDDLVSAINRGEITAFAPSALDKNPKQLTEEINQGYLARTTFSPYDFTLPRYVAAFFNNKKEIFTDANVRRALSYAADKPAIAIQAKEAAGNVALVHSPILPDFYGYAEPKTAYNLDASKADALLDKSGFLADATGQRSKAIKKTPAFQFKSYLKIGSKGSEVTQLQLCLNKLDDTFKQALAADSTGKFGKGTDAAVTLFQKKYLPDNKPTGETGEATRIKLNAVCLIKPANSQSLSFAITTVSQPQLLATAKALQTAWQNIGAQVTINAVSVADIKPLIKNRDYDVLLYGQALGALPDLYPFWHSSQKIDPGLNLCAYENKTADQLLQDARQTTNPSLQQQKLEKLQEVILAEAPALFLYNPNYSYWVSKSVQGAKAGNIIDPGKRFANITQWFINTKRMWK